MCVCVSVFRTRVSGAKTGELIEMLLLGLTHVGPQNNVDESKPNL